MVYIYIQSYKVSCIFLLNQNAIKKNTYSYSKIRLLCESIRPHKVYFSFCSKLIDSCLYLSHAKLIFHLVYHGIKKIIFFYFWFEILKSKKKKKELSRDKINILFFFNDVLLYYCYHII